MFLKILHEFIIIAPPLCPIFVLGDFDIDMLIHSNKNQVWNSETQKPSNFDCSWVSPCPSFFPERLHCCYIDFHCSYFTATINPLEPCALNAKIQPFVLSFSISYWDSIKFPYITDTPKGGVRGVKGGPKTGWRQGDFTDISIISSKIPPSFFCPLRVTRFPSGCVFSGACSRTCWWWGARAAASDDGHRCWPFPGA